MISRGGMNELHRRDPGFTYKWQVRLTILGWRGGILVTIFQIREPKGHI